MLNRRRATEEILDMRIGTPQERRTDARDRRHVRGNHAKDLPQKTRWRPTGEANPSSRATYAHQLAGGLLVIGREHDAERREHHVEARVRIREGLDVTFEVADAEALPYPD